MASSSVPPPAADDEERTPEERRLGRLTTKSISRAEVERAEALREQRMSRKTPDPRTEGEPAAPVERVRLAGEFAEERTGTRSKTPPGDEG